jgi:glycosyltransferase involved in cell wall biosynthesis
LSSDSVVIVAPDGNGSLAGYARSLSACIDAPAMLVNGCSGNFGHRLLGMHSLCGLAADARVVRRLRALRAPLLHLTSHHLARYGPLTGSRYVVTVHDLMRHRDAVERDGGEPLIHRPNRRDRLLLRADAHGLRHADALIAVSEHTKRELIRLLGVPAERIAVVPEGVDADSFRSVGRRLLRDPYVLHVGSEQPRKNLRTLFEAFMRVRELHPGLKLVRVGEAGGSEAPFREATRAHAVATGALQHVVFTDRVSHEDLVAWYSGALCLVQPSRHEGFGLTPVEAMACGCPVIVSSGGAQPEVVGDAGVVYGGPDDVDALAFALSRVLSSAAERADLARMGRRRAEAMTWERTAALTGAVWREALAGSRSPERARVLHEHRAPDDHALELGAERP